MNHQAVPRHSAVNYYNSFGGGNRDFISRNAYPIMPHSTHYNVDGTGRDRYIHINNGGLGASYKPAKAPQHGNFFQFGNHEERSLCRIPSKSIGYVNNGTGRDVYISNNNGGFYPNHTVASYQKTFVKQLRIGWSKTPNHPKNVERAKRSLIRRKHAYDPGYQST
jgi:hypothetical protein